MLCNITPQPYQGMQTGYGEESDVSPCMEGKRSTASI